MKKVYLAGGFQADNWQEKVTKEFDSNVSLENPRGLPTLGNINAVLFFNPKTKERNLDNEIVRKAFSDPKAYTTWDLEAIKHSDYVFAYIDKTNPAVGVIAEVGYAVGLGKQVILVIDPEEEGISVHKGRYFDFLRSMPKVVSFDNLEDGIVFMKGMFELNS